MPNWCYNSATLYNEDKTKIDELASVLSEGSEKVFMHLRPRPADQEESWYEWNCDNWGTKWDVKVSDWDHDSDNSIVMHFDTAWAPPIALYEYLTEDGWSINAMYHEPGMGFAGKFEDGYDEQYEIDYTDRESVEELPDYILDFTNALEDLETYEEEQLEEKLAELERTEWYPANVKPTTDGRYEVITTQYEHPQYANYEDENWTRWIGDKIEVIKWRGLVDQYNEEDEWDPVEELDKIASVDISYRSYEQVVEGWVREFVSTMDEGILRPGDQSGVEPLGVKIIFDGYADLETDDEYIEGGNHSSMSFAVFVHKDSLNGEEFPEHDQTPWALIHRPKDEVCIWVWYNEEDDSVEVIPFEEGDTELDHELIYEIIDKLDKGEYSIAY